MKQLRIATLFLAVMATTAAIASAQAAAPQPIDQATIDKAIEQVRKDARTDVNSIIGATMQFTSDDAAKFWPLYKTYEQQRKALTDERLALVKDYAQNFNAMTDAKATELVQRGLALEEKAAAAKRTFIGELQKALPGKTAARYYQVHNRIDVLIELALSDGIPLVQ